MIHGHQTCPLKEQLKEKIYFLLSITQNSVLLIYGMTSAISSTDEANETKTVAHYLPKHTSLEKSVSSHCARMPEPPSLPV